MKYFVIPFLLLSMVLADPPQATIDALEVPDKIDIPIAKKTLGCKDFPEDLRKELLNLDWGKSDGKLPDQVDCQLLDLNSDQSLEYLVNSRAGGSSGTLWYIFSKRQGVWKMVGECQNYSIVKKQNGWHGIVHTSRGGGEHYTKIFQSFSIEKDEYVTTELHRIYDGKITVEKPKQ